MARINGVNSDFHLQTNGEIKEDQGDPLFMKLFICPYNEPNALEEASGAVCTGIDTACPATPNKTGHALVELNQDNGITLRTDNGNNLQVDQGGNIRLNPNGDLKVKTGFTIKVTGNKVSLESPSGAKVVMQSNGNVDIFTKNDNGNVVVHGNLQYTGTLAKI
ncbi:MAG: hypothetical protein AAFZ15_20015 [Bacteroidota bacterium]